MAELSLEQLQDRLARRELGGDYFLKTDEPFLRDEAIRLLADAHLSGGAPDFDLDQLSGDEVDAETLATRVSTPPMLSEYRVVVVRAAQSLPPSARRVLEEAVTQPVSRRVVVVSAEIPRGSKAKFYDVLRKRCAVVSLPAPRASELPGWLVERAEKVHGVDLSTEAAQRLASAIGGRLGVLARELEKLVDYVTPRDAIGLEDVRSVVGGLPQVDRWSWVDGVMDREFGAAADSLPALLDSGEWPVGLIGSLSESLLRLGLARAGGDALSEALKRDGSYRNLRWKIRIYGRQARRWSGAEIEAALDELLRADRLIKSGGLSDREALEEAILRIAARMDEGESAVSAASSGG